MLPVLLVGLGRKLDNLSTLTIYLISPACCAFISAYILSPKITFDPKKRLNGLIYSFLISILIVIVSLTLWIMPAAIAFHPNERISAPAIAFAAGSVLGWATYPPGLIAGYLVWLISKLNDHR